MLVFSSRLLMVWTGAARAEAWLGWAVRHASWPDLLGWTVRERGWLALGFAFGVWLLAGEARRPKRQARSEGVRRRHRRSPDVGGAAARMQRRGNLEI